MLEVFGTARHAQPTARITLSFRQMASDMRLGSMQHQKEYDSERVGYGKESDTGKSRMREGYGIRKFFEMFVLPSLT